MLRLILDPKSHAGWKWRDGGKKVNRWKNIYHANGHEKKAGVAILILDKVDLKKELTRDKEETDTT